MLLNDLPLTARPSGLLSVAAGSSRKSITELSTTSGGSTKRRNSNCCSDDSNQLTPSNLTLHNQQQLKSRRGSIYDRRPSYLPLLNSNAIKIIINDEKSSDDDESNNNDDGSEFVYDYNCVSRRSSSIAVQPNPIELIKARYEQAIIEFNQQQQQQQQLVKANLSVRRPSVSRRYSLCYQNNNGKYLVPSMKKKNSTPNCNMVKNGDDDEDDDGKSSFIKIPIVKNANSDMKFANILSSDGQCAILKTYEDELYKQIKERMPKKSIPRISTPIYNMKLNKQQKASTSSISTVASNDSVASKFAPSTSSSSSSSSSSSASSSSASSSSSLANTIGRKSSITSTSSCNNSSNSNKLVFNLISPIAQQHQNNALLLKPPQRAQHRASLANIKPPTFAECNNNSRKQAKQTSRNKSNSIISNGSALISVKTIYEQDGEQSGAGVTGGAGETKSVTEINRQIKLAMEILDDLALYDRQKEKFKNEFNHISIITDDDDVEKNSSSSSRQQQTTTRAQIEESLQRIIKKYEGWHSNWCKMFNSLY